MLVYNMPRLSKSNYLEAMADVYSVNGFSKPHDKGGKDGGVPHSELNKPAKKRTRVLDVALEELADELVFVYDLFYKEKFGNDGYYFGSDYFALDRAIRVVDMIDCIVHEDDIRGVMGGDIITGGVNVVYEHIKAWRTRDEGFQYKQRQSKSLEIARQTKETAIMSALSRRPVEKSDQAANSTTDQPITKRKKRTSDQVKADNEAALARAAYNARCLHWLRVEKVSVADLDAKEEAYQRLVLDLRTDPS